MSDNALLTRKARAREFITATAAGAYAGIDGRKIERELPADGTLRSNSGRIFPVWLTSSVDAYAAANEDARVKRAARKMSA